MPGFDEIEESGSHPLKPVIVAGNISKRFGDVVAVSDASFSIDAGTVVGFIGSDGAGKTTLLRIVAAMIPPDSGSMSVAGLDVTAQRWAVKALIGYMPQRFGLYPDLTVDENLEFFLDIYGVKGAERALRKEKYLGFSNLNPFVHRKAGDLSGGMKQKLGLACILIHQPRILILDEPTNGVDPVSRQEFWEILSEMHREGMTLLVSTSYQDEGERCDRILVLHESRIIADGPSAEIRAGFSSLEEAMIHLIEIEEMRQKEGRLAI